MLTLNVDWYNIYNSSLNSCGSIYLTIQNLPKAGARDLKENMILVGIIPGPSEPDGEEMSHYLNPLVEELLKMINGVPIKMLMPDGKEETHTVKAALSLVCCDLPAAKKVSGFVSYHGFYGCHHYKKYFTNIPGSNRRDWSGYDCECWEKRTKQTTDREARIYRDASSLNQKKQLAKKNGTKWTTLNRLPYFDASKFTVVEPMHNLYLGTLRHLVSLWAEELDNQKLKNMKKYFTENNLFVDAEYSIGSIPRKIEIGTGFSYFKAAEWKTWCVSMAPQQLRAYISKKRFDNFMKFRSILCKLENSVITEEEVEFCHQLIMEFSKEFQEEYGTENVMSNQHFHFHLADCIRNYGPISCFWAFNFERYNMFVKNIKNNHKDTVENTLMKRMLHQVFSTDYFRIIQKKNKLTT